MRRSLLLLAVVLLAVNVSARTLVVNPALANAGDGGPATAAEPLRTIGRAAELAQPGDVVRIGAGVYREKVVVKQSGTREQPIVFEAAPGAEVIVTGADPLTGWTLDPEGTFSIPWAHRLYQGDEHNPRGSEQVILDGVLLRKVPDCTLGVR
jgi:hypothetical protein